MVREYSLDQRKFLVMRKLAGASLDVIRQEYAYWWPVNTWHIVNAPAPNTKHALKKLVARFKAHGTLQDRRRRRKAGREGHDTDCTPANVDLVSTALGNLFLNNLLLFR